MSDPSNPTPPSDASASTPAPAAPAELTPQQRERQLSVDAYKASLMKNRAAETRVKELRLSNMDLDAEYNKTEDDLKALQSVGQIIGEVIAQGVASGEFEVEDLEVAALCACTAMMRFFHPQMIAQCATKPGPTIDQMIDFVVAGLSPRARAH